jgi:hypothetical protein
VRSRTAGVMTTLMRNGRDRRSGKPVKCHARKERVRLFGTRSADYIRASGQSGRIQRPNTWLHPNASLKCPIFPLHRGRRPYMALSGQSSCARVGPLLDDAVEKVRSMPPTRNNRIKETDFLNRSCAFDAGFESMLLGDPSQNPFSTVSTHIGHCGQPVRIHFMWYCSR